MADPIQPPKPVGPPPPPQGPNLFDRSRQQVTQRFNAQAQDQGDALRRRFAAMNTLNSGAAIKAQQLQDQDIANQREAAIQGVDSQQYQADEAERQRLFQSGEAQKLRDFQGGQFDKTFGLDERTKLGQLDLARQEMGLKQAEQNFNIGNEARNQGYMYDLSKFLPDDLRKQLYSQDAGQPVASTGSSTGSTAMQRKLEGLRAPPHVPPKFFGRMT